MFWAGERPQNGSHLSLHPLRRTEEPCVALFHPVVAGGFATKDPLPEGFLQARCCQVSDVKTKMGNVTK